MDHTQIHGISLNQTVLHFIESTKPVDIIQCHESESNFVFTVSIDGSESVVFEGHVALLIDDNEYEGNIRAVAIAFKADAFNSVMKTRYGRHFKPFAEDNIFSSHSDCHALLHSLVIWIIQEYSKQNHLKNEEWLELENALLKLVIDSIDRRKQARPEDSAIKHEWFLELEQWIEKNLENSISVEDLSSVAGVSVRTIQKAFKEYRNCTPMDAVTQQRLIKARKMLSNPDEGLSVLDVAMELGYLHPSRFAAQYRKKFGENPSETLKRSKGEK